MSTKQSAEPSVPGCTVSPFGDMDSLAGMRRRREKLMSFLIDTW